MFSDGGYRAAGCNGFKVHTTAAATGVSYYAVVIQEDTVLTAFTTTDAAGTATSQMTNYGITGVTLKAGAYLPAPLGSVITAITASSGSYIGYVK